MKKILFFLFALFPMGAFADGGGQKEMLYLGIPAAQAQVLGEAYVKTAVAAGASSQTNAYKISGTVVTFTTVTTGSADSAILPSKASIPRDVVRVVNAGTGLLQVYPQVGGVINNLAANAAFQVPAGTAAEFSRTTVNSILNWLAVTSNCSGGGPCTVATGLSYGPGYVPTLAATPVIGTNSFLPGLNVIPTNAASNAAFLGANATPVPGECYKIINAAGAAEFIKVAGGATLNGAQAGGKISIASLAEDDCCYSNPATNAVCTQPVIPTPSAP